MNEKGANDFLMGGGVKSASFPDGQYGTEVGGPVVREPKLRQQTDFDDGKPKFYDNGDPMNQVIIHVQTGLRDPLDPEDDGVRALYVKGQMREAVRDGVKAAGGTGVAMGGELYVKYIRDEPNGRGRGKEKKIYSARYVLPAAKAAGDWLLGGGNVPPAAAPPAGPPSAASNPTGAAILAALTPEQRQAILNAGQLETPPF